MSLDKLFGKTTTAVFAAIVQDLASSYGESADNFIKTVASSFSVSVTQENDEFYIVEGDWKRVSDLGNKLLEMQAEINGEIVDTEKVAQDGSDSEARMVRSNNYVETIAMKNSGDGESDPKNSLGESVDDAHQDAHQDAQRKSARNQNKNFPSYADDEVVNDISSDEMVPDEDQQQDDEGTAAFNAETAHNYLGEMDLGLEIVDSLIEETEVPMSNSAEDANMTNLDLTEKLTEAEKNAKTYQCKKCVFSSCYKKCVEDHVKRTHIQKDNKVSVNLCPVCNRCFKKRSDLLRHMAVHNKGNHICLRCGDIFKTNSALRTHIQTHKEGHVKPEFKCSTCGKVYTTKYVLANHVKTIHKGEVRKFTCNLCDKEFTQKGSVVIHKKVVHEGQKLYKCSQCTAEFGHSRLLKNHLQNVHKIIQKSTKPSETIKCDQCDFMTTSKQYLADHKCRSHQQKNFSCSECDTKFSYASGLNKHMKLHRSVCRCSVCNKVYKDPRSLERHIMTHDPNYQPQKVQCEICKRLVTNKYVLAIHKMREHGEGERVIYNCDQCNRSFKQKISLDEHQLMHRGERPWECKVCGQTYTYRTSLRKHMRKHSGNKLYMCHVCGKTFKTPEGLRTHSDIHANPNKYKCHCGKGFTQKQALIRHERVHTGEKPFLCHLCPETFGDSSILRRHIQGVHKTPYNARERSKSVGGPQPSMCQAQDKTETVLFQAEAANDNNPSEGLSDPQVSRADQPMDTQPSQALSLLAGLCVNAEQVPGYHDPRGHVNIFTPPAYNVMPPESPSMPALIPVTQPCSPPPENPQNLSTLVSTAFQAIQTSHTHLPPSTFSSHGHPHPHSKSSW